MSRITRDMPTARAVSMARWTRRTVTMLISPSIGTTITCFSAGDRSCAGSPDRSIPDQIATRARSQDRLGFGFTFEVMWCAVGPDGPAGHAAILARVVHFAERTTDTRGVSDGMSRTRWVPAECWLATLRARELFVTVLKARRALDRFPVGHRLRCATLAELACCARRVLARGPLTVRIADRQIWAGDVHVLGPVAGCHDDLAREVHHERIVPFWWRDERPGYGLTVLAPLYLSRLLKANVLNGGDGAANPSAGINRKPAATEPTIAPTVLRA